MNNELGLPVFTPEEVLDTYQRFSGWKNASVKLEGNTLEFTSVSTRPEIQGAKIILNKKGTFLIEEVYGRMTHTGFGLMDLLGIFAMNGFNIKSS